MANLTLVIGTKKYSSWSLRPWLALKHAGLPFEEVEIDLRQPDTSAEILRHSPSGKVPVLKNGDLLVWDSLAICEYVAELACARPMWPEHRAARAVARAVSAEMHSGFTALRRDLPMDVALRQPDFRPGDEAAADIARIREIWRDCRKRYGSGGPFLFGPFSLADAMYAPVVFRFQSYGVALDEECSAYQRAMLALPAMQQWAAESS
jgi:glutathione S-transferase